jgi:HK97 family phage prohead protease
MNVEYITIPLELKALESGQFEGYGSTFGNVDLGGDVVMKGAFEESLANWRKSGDWPQMFWMHRPDMVPGVWLDMHEDTKGLKVKGELIDTSIGNDVRVMMKRGAVKALSIGFSLDSPDSYSFKDGVRLLHQINLWETSPVTMPMNPKAKINAVKARLHQQGVSLPDFKRELEHWMREKGLSKSQATSLASRALSGDELSDIDFGAMPKSGDESGEIPEDSRRDAGKADGELEQAAKTLHESLREKQIDREIVDTKLDEDKEFEESLKTLADDLVAFNFERRWRKTG